MTNCIYTDIHMDIGCKLKKDIESNKVDLQLYKSLVDSLIYATNAKHDICYVVCNVSHYMESPKEIHWQATR